jgi:hypothetical protein
MDNLHEDLTTFMISCWIILRMRNFSDKIVEKMEMQLYIQYFSS